MYILITYYIVVCRLLETCKAVCVLSDIMGTRVISNKEEQISLKTLMSDAPDLSEYICETVASQNMGDIGDKMHRLPKGDLSIDDHEVELELMMSSFGCTENVYHDGRRDYEWKAETGIVCVSPSTMEVRSAGDVSYVLSVMNNMDKSVLG